MKPHGTYLMAIDNAGRQHAALFFVWRGALVCGCWVPNWFARWYSRVRGSRQ